MKRSGVAVGLLLSCVLVLGVAACKDLGTTTTTVASTTTVTAESTTTSVEVTTTAVKTGPPTRWTKYDLSGEPSDGFFEMVYVPTIGKALLFGGSPGGDDPDYSSSLWGYDPVKNAWASLGDGGPSGRVGHSMVYIPTIDKVVFFAGNEGAFDYPYRGDLWSYDPATDEWTELHPAGEKPTARSEQRMVFDPNTGKVIMFGGQDDDGAMTGLWAYDPVANAWSRPRPAGSGPGVRFGHTMVYDPVTRKILVFGGLAKVDYGSAPPIERLSDLWAYDAVANTWTELKPSRSPGYRSYAQMVYHPGSRLMIMFGGEGKAEYDYPTTLWAYDSAANSWTKLTPADRLPFGRIGHGMVYDPSSDKIIMFGGEKSDFTLLQGTWTLTP